MKAKKCGLEILSTLPIILVMFSAYLWCVYILSIGKLQALAFLTIYTCLLMFFSYVLAESSWTEFFCDELLKECKNGKKTTSD